MTTGTETLTDNPVEHRGSWRTALRLAAFAAMTLAALVLVVALWNFIFAVAGTEGGFWLNDLAGLFGIFLPFMVLLLLCMITFGTAGSYGSDVRWESESVAKGLQAGSIVGLLGACLMWPIVAIPYLLFAGFTLDTPDGHIRIMVDGSIVTPDDPRVSRGFLYPQSAPVPIADGIAHTFTLPPTATESLFGDAGTPTEMTVTARIYPEHDTALEQFVQEAVSAGTLDMYNVKNLFTVPAQNKLEGLFAEAHDLSRLVAQQTLPWGTVRVTQLSFSYPE